MGGRCSRRLYALRDGDAGHRSCQENLAEALAAFGLSGDDIIDGFNVFMNVEMRPDGSFTILSPTARKGVYTPHDGRAKPLGITVFGPKS